MLGEVSQTESGERLMKFTLMASDYQVRTSIFKRQIRLKQSGVNAEAFHLRTHLDVVCHYWPVIGVILQKHKDVSLNLCEYSSKHPISKVALNLKMNTELADYTADR